MYRYKDSFVEVLVIKVADCSTQVRHSNVDVTAGSVPSHRNKIDWLG